MKTVPAEDALSPPPPDKCVNIAASLAAMAETQPHTLAIAQPFGRDRRGRIRYRHYTYSELNAESDVLARGFEQIGIRRGVRTVLMVTPSLEFFALTFALFKVGAAIVLIDPGMGTKSLGVCLAEAAPEAFVGIPRAHLAAHPVRLGPRKPTHLCHRGAAARMGRLHTEANPTARR